MVDSLLTLVKGKCGCFRWRRPGATSTSALKGFAAIHDAVRPA
jgi:hypothetical protein